jgi:predicted transcriptional regulator YheO
MGEKELILETLKQVADAIVNFWRTHCEVAVHDLTQLDKSLVYIAGDVTKRRTGSPITDLVVQALRKDGDRVHDVLNYRTVAKDGRVLKSSTFFFRGKNGKVIGALCINLDTTEFMNAIQFVETFIRTNNEDGVGQNRRETFASSASETIESLVGQIVAETGKQPSTMSKRERVQFIKALEERGVFLIKGAVDHAAAIAGVSKFTVYGYLQKIRAGHVASADSRAHHKP